MANTATRLITLIMLLQRHPNQQVQQRAPSPYGVYNTVYTGELLTYQPYVPGGLLKLLD